MLNSGFYEAFSPITTERLVIRKLGIGDAEDIYAVSRNPAVSRYVLWETHRSIADSRSMIRGVLRSYRAQEPAALGIVLRETGHVVGTIGFLWIDREHNAAEIGYSLTEELWNRGLMTEALRAMLCSVRADLPFYRKAAKIRGTNGFAESVCLHISELMEQELTQSGFTHVDGIPHLNARNLARFYAYRVLFDILELLEEDSEYSIEEILDAYAYLDRHSVDSFWGGNDPAEGRGFPKT